MRHRSLTALAACARRAPADTNTRKRRDFTTFGWTMKRDKPLHRILRPARSGITADGNRGDAYPCCAAAVAHLGEARGDGVHSGI
jgi:hypothetical protein